MMEKVEHICQNLCPGKKAVSFQQLRDFDAKVHQECRVTYPVILVREVVDQIVQPALVSVCLSHGSQ
jgi:hypothetical protein